MPLSPDEQRVAHRFGEALFELLVQVEKSITEHRADVLAKTLQRHEPPVAKPVATRTPPPPPPPSPSPSQVEPVGHAPSALLRTKDAAEFLAIGERKLWEITSPRGPVPVVKFGKAVRYRVQDLEAVIQQRTNRRGR